MIIGKNNIINALKEIGNEPVIMFTADDFNISALLMQHASIIRNHKGEGHAKILEEFILKVSHHKQSKNTKQLTLDNKKQ